VEPADGVQAQASEAALPVSATTLGLLMAAGLQGNALVAVVAAIDDDFRRQSADSPPTSAHDRRKAYDRDRMRAKRSQREDESADVGGPSLPASPSSPLPPRPPITTPSPSPITPARANGKHSIDEEFEREFWPNVPRKVGKPAALKAYRAARKKASAEVLSEGIRRYASERAGQDASFTAYPSTWLNQDRWADELTLTTGPPADAEREAARRRIEEHNAKIARERGTG
jgi:hypothetical protein